MAKLGFVKVKSALGEWVSPFVCLIFLGGKSLLYLLFRCTGWFASMLVSYSHCDISTM